MADKRRRREHQNIASGGGSLSRGTPRSNSSPSSLNSIDTLGAPQSSLDALASSHQPLDTRSPHVSLTISSKINTPDGPTTGRVGDKPIVYATKGPQDEGRELKNQKSETSSKLARESCPSLKAVQRNFEERVIIDLTMSRSPTPKLDDLPRHINQISACLASSRINQVVAGRDRVYADENRYHNCDGRAPPPDLVGSIPNDKAQIDDFIKDEFVDNQNKLQVVKSPENNEQSSKLANDELPRKISDRNHRIPVQSTSSAKHVSVVQSTETDDSVEASASAQGDAMEIDECTDIGTSVEAAKPGEAKKKRKGKRGGKGKGKGKGDAKNANGQNTTRFDDRHLGSDLAQIPSDSEQDPLKDQSDRIMSEAEVQQAILDALTVPVFPKAPPNSMVIDEKAYKLAEEGEYFTLSHALFSVVPKEVYDRIWKDEYERPQISLSTKTPKWIRPLDPTIKRPAKPESDSNELIKVLCEIEKLLISVWVGVESIVVVLYSELDGKHFLLLYTTSC